MEVFVIKMISGDLAKLDTPCLVIPVSENKNLFHDPLISGLIQKAINSIDFKAKSGEEIFFYDMPEVKAKRTLFIGLGKFEKINGETLRAAAGKSIKRCIKRNISTMIFCVPDEGEMPGDSRDMLEGLMEGACLSNYIFDQYKKDKKHKPLKQIAFYSHAHKDGKSHAPASSVETVCRGTILAREWVNLPPNDKRPEQFVQSIRRKAENENIRISILDEKALKKHKMGGILAVGSGSRSRPSMIILDYSPKKSVKSKTKIKTVALVGKGVTFDSGGINLKPSDGLADMKMDMSGAAAVAAALITISRLKIGLRVVGLIPIVENMPSGDAARPGDIITTFSGKTVEIGNTDAEGRLILIDAMSYAEKVYKPDAMIDLATLTGACVVALGEKIAGVFSRNRELADHIIDSGEKTHERCWMMPMPEDYKEMLKSDFADIKNITGVRWGGAITAALFLSEFVQTDRWAHIDIAGPAYAKKETDYCAAGGTGFGVRLVMDVIKKI
jgi:leucyl aminopeptidase